MQQWEYDCTEQSYRLVELMEILVGKGKQGWELASVVEERRFNGQIRYRAIFKRPHDK
jgi:hypothetical protein